VIPGEHINLRAVERNDAPLVQRWLNDPQVMRGWGWSAPARSFQGVAQEIEDWLAQEIAHGRPTALLAETLDGEPIGLVILRVDRQEAHSVELSLLVGDSSLWGRGYGRDILQTSLDACFDGWGIHRVSVRVEDDNDRAVSLYRRAGFSAEGRLRQAAFRDGRRSDILLFGLLAPEWRSQQDDATHTHRR
jgi:RimJ/RimL family protein N-acetyltransferase